MQGFYAVYFTGVAGSGHAVFILADGRICGADAVGGLLDGTYEQLGDGSITVKVAITAPAGVQLVTGATSGQHEIVQEVKISLPSDFASGSVILIQLPTGPVNAIFRRLRDLP